MFRPTCANEGNEGESQFLLFFRPIGSAGCYIAIGKSLYFWMQHIKPLDMPYPCSSYVYILTVAITLWQS